MRVVIQRVSEASVAIGGEIYSAIGPGLMILVGIENTDTQEDAAWLVKKISLLRIFDDSRGVMNLDIMQTRGEILAVSQFTLHASTKKGNRPSYFRAAGEAVSKPMYEKFTQLLSETLGKPVETGVFGADMKVTLINDGPVTIIMDSKQKDI